MQSHFSALTQGGVLSSRLGRLRRRTVTPKELLNADLEAALVALEASFHVRLIATFDPDLVWAPAAEEAASWLASHHLEFDQFPVRSRRAAVGLLLRGNKEPNGTVLEAMVPIREGVMVAADMPITDLICELGTSHCRLVLRGGRIDGLVTRSDLLKLPVRMLVFGLITHLELCLRQLVRARLPWPSWLGRLEDARRRAVELERRRLTRARLEPDSLEFTTFSDVVTILSSEPGLGVRFKEDMDGIRKLRNDVAHAKTYIGPPADTADFVERFVNTRKWITRITRKLKAP